MMSEKDKFLCKYFGEDIRVNIKTNKVASTTDKMYDRHHKNDDNYIQRTEKRRLVTGKTFIINLTNYFLWCLLGICTVSTAVIAVFSMYMTYIERYLLWYVITADRFSLDYTPVIISNYAWFGIIFWFILGILCLYAIYYSLIKLWKYLAEYTIVECEYNKKIEEKTKE